MGKKLLFEEQTIVELMAESAVNRYMIQMLTSSLLRLFPADQRGPWLDDRIRGFNLPIGLPTPDSELGAVLLSDVAVLVRERGVELLESFKPGVASYIAWEDENRRRRAVEEFDDFGIKWDD